MADDALPATAHARPTPCGRVAAAVLALLFLNGMLSFKEWWPTPGSCPTIGWPRSSSGCG